MGSMNASNLPSVMDHMFSTHRGKNQTSRMPLWLTIVTIVAGLTFLGLQLYIFRSGSMEMDAWTYPIG